MPRLRATLKNAEHRLDVHWLTKVSEYLASKIFTFILRVLYETLKNVINFVTRGDDVNIGVGQIQDKLKDVHKL